jgi:urate oxidase
MTAHLAYQSYGKHRVRVSKIKRPRKSPAWQEIHELVEVAVDVELQGAFDAAYTAGDNSMVIATDTCRNTIYALAKDDCLDSIESFGVTIGNHFLRHYAHVNHVTVRLSGRRWHRLLDCPHGFIGTDSETPSAVVTARRDTDFVTTVHGGLENLMVAKTTQSGFADFHRDEFRTLADTTDRILATSMSASWAYIAETRAAENLAAESRADVTHAFITARESIRSALLTTFINHYSRSVQETLFKMAQAALAATDAIDSITLTMPNKHHIPFNLAPLDRVNDNEIFVVTDEPFGYISATVNR